MAFLRRRFAIPLIALLAVGVIGTVLLAQKMKLPKPQITSAAGTPAPDFTLSDQNAQPYHLADQKGHRLLVIFYRGYW